MKKGGEAVERVVNPHGLATAGGVEYRKMMMSVVANVLKCQVAAGERSTYVEEQRADMSFKHEAQAEAAGVGGLVRIFTRVSLRDLSRLCLCAFGSFPCKLQILFIFKFSVN